jgi:hypothetical protein
MIYPDLTMLLSLLVPGENTQEASNLLRQAENLPLTLSVVHRLQVENALLRYLHGSDANMKALAKDGLLLWRQYLREGVFEIHSFPLPEGFTEAAAWNAESRYQPPRWHLLIHVALAASQNAAFMSVDPVLRRRAVGAGLVLIPKKL